MFRCGCAAAGVLVCLVGGLQRTIVAGRRRSLPKTESFVGRLAGPEPSRHHANRADQRSRPNDARADQPCLHARQDRLPYHSRGAAAGAVAAKMHGVVLPPPVEHAASQRHQAAVVRSARVHRWRASEIARGFAERGRACRAVEIRVRSGDRLGPSRDPAQACPGRLHGPPARHVLRDPRLLRKGAGVWRRVGSRRLVGGRPACCPEEGEAARRAARRRYPRRRPALGLERRRRDVVPDGIEAGGQHGLRLGRYQRLRQRLDLRPHRCR
mmetsp:Transcript_25394/g.72357  ORF Transcript_25394/g.72357 Transcript_25394/m.72357 type:complete len:269 (-) Transcript_25394:187-993(-)